MGDVLGEKRIRDFAKLETAEHSPWLEHSMRLPEHLIHVSAIPDPERDGVEIDRVVLNRVEGLCVPQDK